MKKFFFRLFLLVILPVLLMEVLLFGFYRFIGSKYLLSDDLYNKVQGLIVSKNLHPDIIIGGDSRAAKNIDPIQLGKLSGLVAVNIATPNGYFYETENALHKYNLGGKKSLIIVSMSIFQINSALGKDYQLSYAEVANLDLVDELKLYNWDFNGWYSAYTDSLGSLIKQVIIRPNPPETISDGGFEPVDGAMPLPVSPGEIYLHPWYKQIGLDGWKWAMFQSSLRDMAKQQGEVVLYLAPNSPSWAKLSVGNKVGSAENLFASMIASEAAKYPNVAFLDFYHQNIPQLQDDKFYDIQHLNYQGAEIFTKILYEKLKSLGLLGS